MGRKRKRSRKSKINVPARIRKRWLNSHSGTEYRLESAYSQANVNSEKFKECWKTLQPTLSEEELFDLFDGGFGSPGRCRKSNLERKVKFIKHILRLGHPGTRTVERVRINVPGRIKKRWRSTYRKGTEFEMGQALSNVHVNAEEFKTCWKTVQPTLSEEDLFDLFVGTFGSGDDVNLKINFIKDILGRCKGPRMVMQETRAQVSSDDNDVSRASVVSASQRSSMKSVETQAQISTGSRDGRYTKDQVKDQFFRDFNLDSWFDKHAASDGTVSQNQIHMKLVKHALSTVTRILGDVDFLSKSKRDAVTEKIEESSDTRDSGTANGDVSTDDDENVVHVGDQFVYSDDEEGDSTFTVRRIVRGGLVYVEEDDESLCLQYVRKKVRVFD